jgi:Tfp pilus assembly protein PilN
MIEINLLPGDRRPARGTPFPRFVTMLAGIVFFCLGLIVLAVLLMAYDREKYNLDNLRGKLGSYDADLEELAKVEAELSRVNLRVRGLTSLSDDRRIWWRVLHRLHDPKLLPDHIWYKEIQYRIQAGGGKGAVSEELKLECLARPSESGAGHWEMMAEINEFRRRLHEPQPDFSEHVQPGGVRFSPVDLHKFPTPRGALADAPRTGAKFSVTIALKPMKQVRDEAAAAAKAAALGAAAPR